MSLKCIDGLSLDPGFAPRGDPLILIVVTARDTHLVIGIYEPGCVLLSPGESGFLLLILKKIPGQKI